MYNCLFEHPGVDLQTIHIFAHFLISWEAEEMVVVSAATLWVTTHIHCPFFVLSVVTGFNHELCKLKWLFRSCQDTHTHCCPTRI